MGFVKVGSLVLGLVLFSALVPPPTSAEEIPPPAVSSVEPEPTSPVPEVTADPTPDPTLDPTPDPTLDPTPDPTLDPTPDPTLDPTPDPTLDPTPDPTLDPTPDPTLDPTLDPTPDPTLDPTPGPSPEQPVTPATTIQRTAEQRIGGADRYATAANVARWLPVGDGHRVVVTTGELFPDALSAGPMAAREQSRLILTRSASLPDAVAAELRRSVPEEIIIVGGPGAVSATVASQLAAIAPVTRIAGADRYATAAGVAAGMTTTDVVIASGESFPDALAAGPLAAKLGAPLLLARQLSLPPATSQALQDLAPTTVTVLGGPGAVGDAVVQEIRRITGATVVRIGGTDRYDTAAKVALTYFDGADTALLASGVDFPDGLSGAPLAHAYGAPMLLSNGTCAPVPTTSALASLSPAYRFYLGGVSVVTSSPTPCGTSAIRRGVNPPRASIPDDVPTGSAADEAFYFVPHQDDELISMAGGIARDINAGYRVHVFLIFAGYWTSVKDYLCEDLNRCLTNSQITASRNAELLTSLERLGVPAGNVHFLYVTEEESDAEEVAGAAMAEIMAAAGPDARFRSMSWLDAHPSHYRLGHAVRELCDTDRIDDCLFFQSTLYQVLPQAIGTRPVVTPMGNVLTTQKDRVQAAAAAYKEDYPALGRHAVGWRSVSQQITWIEQNAYSWAHGRTWASAADRRAADVWMQLYQPEYYSVRTLSRAVATELPFEEYTGG
ncbi:cell wall-binding repeat-containing protein [Tessaracoccus sp. G1721]